MVSQQISVVQELLVETNNTHFKAVEKANKLQSEAELLKRYPHHVLRNLKKKNLMTPPGVALGWRSPIILFAVKCESFFRYPNL